MRVLFITSAYPTQTDDPRGIFIHRLARGICREGIKITVIAPGSPNASCQEEIDSVAVYRVTYWIPRWQRLATGLSGIVPNLKQRPWLFIQVPSLITALTWRALKLARSHDIIHAHWLYPAGIAGLIAAKRYQIPLVMSSHGGDLNLAQRSRLLRVLCSRVSRESDVCIGVSQNLCEQFHRLGVPEERTRYIPVGADTDILSDWLLKRDEVYQHFKNYPGLKILYVGSLIPRKSVETLLKAHHKLQMSGYSIATAIVGAGPVKPCLESMVRDKLMTNVFLVNEKPPTMVPAWMSAADVFVLPSLSEGQPTVIMESMALGLPTIATDIPGTRELIYDGETGFLFPPQDAEALAACIKRFIDHEELKEQMSMRGRLYVQRNGLTSTHVAQKHVAIYSALLQRKDVFSSVTTPITG
jgi:glycosyltransferase involved in cell wall biosynthesis